MSGPPGTPALRIRRARGRDVGLLAALEAVAFAHPWSEPQLAAQLAGGSSAIWLLSSVPHGGGQPEVPLVYALFLVLPGESELLRVATRPDRRRQGLAARVLRRALRVLERAGRSRAHLEVASVNLPAIALYERLGFFVSGRRAAYYTDGSDALTMTRGPVRSG